MNNDKYAKYGKQVRYAANGAYHVHTNRGNTQQNDGCLKELLTVILVIASLLFGYSKVKADTLYIVDTSPALYQCLGDNQVNPSQDNTYPPEGYHCRPHYEGNTVVPVPTKTHRKERDSQIDTSQVLDTYQVVTVEDTIIADNPIVDNPANEEPPTNEDKKDKHPNNGGGNGQELDNDGNDLDPNDNPHANDND